MAATAEMPYFIKPSVRLGAAEKERAYEEAERAIVLTLGEERDRTIKMVTINCLLKTYLPYYYWVGFYLNRGDETLSVGPYQGTLGCLYIKFGRGVCGTVAATGTTKIVRDTHALEPGREHIACDPNSRSEIVVPVHAADGSLLGVFDVDSTVVDSFDKTDRKYLERLLNRIFAE